MQKSSVYRTTGLMYYKNVHWLVLYIGVVFLLSKCSKKKVAVATNTPVQNSSKNESIDAKDAAYPIYTSNDYGTTWQNINHRFPKDIRVSYLDRIGNDILMATDNQGIFIKEYAKEQWIQIGEALPGKKINALHVNGNSIYVGVYKQGIFVSEDKGISWNSLNYNLPDLRVQSILKNKDRLVVGTDTGIFELPNGSVQWANMFFGPQINSLSIYKGEILAGTSLGAIMSKNHDKEWKWILKEGAVINTSVVDGKMLLMHMSGELFVSNDFGSFYKSKYDQENQICIYELVKMDDHWIMSNSNGLYQSMDQGENWEHVHKTENMAFFDLLVVGNNIYGGVTRWTVAK